MCLALLSRGGPAWLTYTERSKITMAKTTYHLVRNYNEITNHDERKRRKYERRIIPCSPHFSGILDGADVLRPHTSSSIRFNKRHSIFFLPPFYFALIFVMLFQPQAKKFSISTSQSTARYLPDDAWPTLFLRRCRERPGRTTPPQL